MMPGNAYAAWLVIQGPYDDEKEQLTLCKTQLELARDLLQDMKRWKLKMVSSAAPSTCRSITTGGSVSHSSKLPAKFLPSFASASALEFVYARGTGVYLFPVPLSTLSGIGFAFNKHTTLHKRNVGCAGGISTPIACFALLELQLWQGDFLLLALLLRHAELLVNNTALCLMPGFLPGWR